jgi:hypothetical protein
MVHRETWVSRIRAPAARVRLKWRRKATTRSLNGFSHINPAPCTQGPGKVPANGPLGADQSLSDDPGCGPAACGTRMTISYEDLKVVPLFNARSDLTTEANRTWAWRFLRLLYDEKTGPCCVACPASEDVGRIRMPASQGIRIFFAAIMVSFSSRSHLDNWGQQIAIPFR